jgi:hypothetical protein
LSLACKRGTESLMSCLTPASVNSCITAGASDQPYVVRPCFALAYRGLQHDSQNKCYVADVFCSENMFRSVCSVVEKGPWQCSPLPEQYVTEAHRGAQDPTIASRSVNLFNSEMQASQPNTDRQTPRNCRTRDELDSSKHMHSGARAKRQQKGQPQHARCKASIRSKGTARHGCNTIQKARGRCNNIRTMKASDIRTTADHVGTRERDRPSEQTFAPYRRRHRRNQRSCHPPTK